MDIQTNSSAVPSASFTEKITTILQQRPVVLQLLRFGAIGVFNTAMDALVLNFMSAQFGITKGSGVGWINLPGFILAVIQSYYWNKYWAFDNQAISLLKNFLRLAGVGVVGVVVFGLVFLGGHTSARPEYFIGIFVVFLLAQVVLWYMYGFFKALKQQAQRIFLNFLIVSVIGFLINSFVLYATTTHGSISSNAGDNLNIGKLAATVASLVWNFIGYKLFVFKK